MTKISGELHAANRSFTQNLRRVCHRFGAGGGTAAKVLTEGGLSVVMLEAGPPLNPEKDYKEHMWPYELPHRGAGSAETPGETGRRIPRAQRRMGDRRRAVHVGSGIAIPLVPFAHCRRTHQSLGTHRVAFRSGGFQVQLARRHGRRLAHFLRRHRALLRQGRVLHRRFRDQENISSAPDGVFLPPPKPRCTEILIKKACDKLNIICIPSRLAILTKPLNGRAACHYCGQCGRGCVTASNFSSSQVMIPPAQATGRLTLITGAMARELLSEKTAKRKPCRTSTRHTPEKRVACQSIHGRGQCLRIRAVAAEFQVDIVS